MKSWVDIKKNNQTLKVPYQAFKDVFEHDGFTLVVDESLSVEPTFSNSNEIVDSGTDKAIETNATPSEGVTEKITQTKGVVNKNVNSNKRANSHKGAK